MLISHKFKKIVPILKPETWLKSHLTNRWMIYSSQNLLFYYCPTLVKSHVFFKIIRVFFKTQSTVLGERTQKKNYREPSVKLKLLGLPHMVKTGPEPAWPPQSFKSKRFKSATKLVSVEIKSPHCWVFNNGLADAVRDEWEVEVKPNVKSVLPSNGKNQLLL